MKRPFNNLILLEDIFLDAYFRWVIKESGRLQNVRGALCSIQNVVWTLKRRMMNIFKKFFLNLFFLNFVMFLCKSGLTLITAVYFMYELKLYVPV